MPQRLAPTMNVYLDGVLRNDLVPITVQRSAGGIRADHAVIAYDRSVLGLRIEDLALSANNSHSIEILGALNGQTKVYFWGKQFQWRIQINEASEQEEFVARIDPWAFGQPIWGQVVWDPQSGAHQHVDRDLVFNPLIDGVIVGNMRTDRALGPARTACFLDDKSVRGEQAVRYQGGEPTFWTLSAVIYYLCQQANPLQTHIANPPLAELVNVMDDARDLVRDLKLQLGYLPEMLDRVLEPFGYAWFVEPLATGRRKISLFKRGIGRRLMHVGLQRGGTVVAGPQQPGASNVAACNIEYDISELYNAIRGLGGFLEIEATWNLYAGWDTAYDSLVNTPDSLNKEKAGFLGNAYRLFVLNESGEYTGLRPEIRRPFDFRPAVANALGIHQNEAARYCVPKRRRFLPTLTLSGGAPIGHVEGCRVEISNLAQTEWRTASETCRLLEDECGVYFDDVLPPASVLQGGKVRITATIRFDQRLEGLATRQSSSVQGDHAELVLDLRDRFHARVIDSQSIYYARVKSGELKSNAADHRAAIAVYCAQIRDAWDRASVAGQVELEGVDWPYEVGDSITSIAGRNISFNGRAAGTPQFPQVAGITYEFQRQRTVLQLERYRHDRQ